MDYTLMNEMRRDIAALKSRIEKLELRGARTHTHCIKLAIIITELKSKLEMETDTATPTDSKEI